MTDMQPGTIEDLTTDLEQFAGDEIPDPWDDEDQTDWPQNPDLGEDEE